MFRSPRSRNDGRNKGIKIKHVFQISLLLGVSLWLLYQVYHSDDKKVSNITHKLRNVHSKDMYKLGRKDLSPKVNGKNSSKENQSDERGNGSEDEEAAHESHDDHESEEGDEMKHEPADDREESDGKDDGNEKNTKTKYDDEEKGRGKIQTDHKGESKEDGGKKNEGTKEENGSKKSGGKENIKLKSKNKDEGRKKEMKHVHKEHKQNDGGEQAKGKVNEDKSNEQNKVEKIEKMRPNTKAVEISSPPEGNDHSVRDEIENDKMTDKGKREIESGEDDTSPYSYSVPSFEFETVNSVNDDGDSEGQDKQQVSNEKDDGPVLEEEKDALTDLGTLPESETGGSISHDDAAAE